MATLCQFVSAITASPTVRLDLNSASSGLMVDAAGTDLSPPPLRRAVSASMLTVGDQVTWATPENRLLRIPLRLVYQAGSDAAATALQALARELSRHRNLVRVQFHGATSPVFFRTYAAPDFTLSMLRLQLAATGQVVLEIPAEPYAVGLEESLGIITVNNDPAAGSNPLYFDVAAANAKGDVPTPLYIRTTTSLAGVTCILATRRRGTPSGGVYFAQCEALTNGTDTADIADTGASGGNEVRTTFATVSAYADRVTGTLPSSTASAELRGTYRVFVRHEKGATGTVHKGKLRIAGTVDLPEITVPDVTGHQLVDYGLLQIPWGSAAERDGYGAELGAGGVSVAVRLTRVSGSGDLDSDYILLVPADAELAMVSWPSSPAGPAWVFDGPNDEVYWRGTSGVTHVVSASGGAFPTYVGALPMISPNQVNRVWFVRANSLITAQTDLTVTYFPRYLTVRPAST